MLEITGLDVHIEASQILKGVSLRVEPREAVCLVGRNGAGKTTILRTIMGYRRPSAGAITLKGESIAGLPTHAIARRGVGFAPEDSEIFGDLSVAENIELPTWTLPGTRRTAAQRVDLAYEIFPRLRAYAARGGTQLSGGERKMLSIARALALDPELLLLDEPFEGLSPAIIPAIGDALEAITRLGPGLLLAESNIHHVPAWTARLYVIERGEIVFAGRPDEIHGRADLSRIIGHAL
jgi:branched-chain amino acid transport system ATP-binding protein